MQIIRTQRGETRTVSIRAQPRVVFEFLGNPHNLPRWAPNFARSVRAAGEDWIIDQAGAERQIRVRVSAEHGTVDLLAAGRSDRGAFMRVVPNGDGSEFLFTLFFGGEVGEAAVLRQMRIVEAELETVRVHCENAAGPA
jgi:hypothetical protein